MNSLRSHIFVFLTTLVSALCLPSFAVDEISASSRQESAESAGLSDSDSGSGQTSQEGKASESESESSDADLEDSAKNKKKKKAKQKKQADDNEKSGSKDAEEKGPELTAEELQAIAAAEERARQLRSFKTPFNTSLPESASDGTLQGPSRSSSLRSSLASKLVSARVYLPSKMIIGKASEFVIKGRAGSHVAIAMADKDSGAKPLLGHQLRLGPDRKLVAAGTIPDLGVLTLIVDMPVQGDLIGLPVFFETTVWQKPDYSDMQIAQPVKSETVAELADKANAVIVAADHAQKRGLRFVPDSAVPLHQRRSVGLDSGRP